MRKSSLDRSAVERRLLQVLKEDFKPLLIAASYGFTRLLRHILEALRETRLEQEVYHDGGQAAVLAAKHDYIESVRLLIENGANINAVVDEYGTALQAASAEGYEDVVRILLDRGTDIDAEGGDHGTALQAASVRDHVMIVRLLLDHGANVDAGGGKYGNALSAACSWNNQDVVRVLRSKGASLESGLLAACHRNHVQSVRRLLNEGADVNACDLRQRTALEIASLGGNVLVMQLLLENNADVHSRGGKFLSAISAAACCIDRNLYKTTLVPLLLKHVVEQALAFRTPTCRWKLKDDWETLLPVSATYNPLTRFQEMKKHRILCHCQVSVMNDAWISDVIYGLKMVYTGQGDHEMLQRLSMLKESSRIESFPYYVTMIDYHQRKYESFNHYDAMICDAPRHDVAPKYDNAQALTLATRELAKITVEELSTKTSL
jgi:ankyrin repeat protein